jgi:hypothetical protein
MLDTSNSTPFTLGAFVLPDAQGADNLILVAKGTFDVSKGAVAVAAEQQPIVVADVYWGEPGLSSLKYASEVHLGKTGTDVVMVGSVHAPQGRPVTELGFSLAVGPSKKVIYAVGDRTFTRGGSASAPAPTLSVPLTYERAYGGFHQPPKGPRLFDPRNPVGRGFRGQRKAGEMAGLPYPSLFDPRQLRDDLSERTIPVGVGYVAPNWEPRVSYGGTYGAPWEEKRAPFLPEDFDPRFLQAASSGLTAPQELRGGEPIEIVNGAPPPHSVQKYVLPRCELRAEVCIGSKKTAPRLSLDTVLLEPEQTRFSLIWLGMAPCHNQATRIERVSLAVDRLEGARS